MLLTAELDVQPEILVLNCKLAFMITHNCFYRNGTKSITWKAITMGDDYGDEP